MKTRHVYKDYFPISAAIFIAGLSLYVFTLAPGLLWGGGDFALFQTRLYTGELRGDIWGHPLWVVVAHPFIWLPWRDVAYRANLSAAVFAALALVFVFHSARRLTGSIAASLGAAGILAVSHFFWLFAVTPKVYSLNELLLAVCVYLLLRWRDESRDRYLYLFAVIYGLSLFNHLVMAIGSFGFAVYVLIVLREKHTFLWRKLVLAAFFFMLGLSPYIWIITLSETRNSTNLVQSFVQGLAAAASAPLAWIVGLVLGLTLWVYQFPIAVFPGIVGALASWKKDRAVAVLFTLIAVGNFAFVIMVTGPQINGEMIWNLQYYFPLYMVFALWIAIGLAEWLPHWTLLRQNTAIALCIAVPIALYAIAPLVARPFLSNMPGFREIGNRDNLTYVLSPWKQNETGARPFGESILNALPPHSTLFADYSIWAVVNYLQVVEGARPDVTLFNLSSAPDGQLKLIQSQSASGGLFLGDANRYYDLDAIRQFYNVVPAGPVYRLVPKP